MPTQTIWCVSDQLAGHRSQLLGLANALQHVTGARVHWLPPDGPIPAEPPWLIIAAGRSTHWRALRLRWLRGGRLVVLMRPGLPRWLFDACIVPEHDGLAADRRTWLTRGPLNPVQVQSTLNPEQGLILLGGPSRHHGWDLDALLAQVETLRRCLGGMHWTLTTSRRTPESALETLRQLAGPGLEFVPAGDAPAGWLLSQYRQCGIIWATEDSAAMVYEALSSGAAVGVLAMPRKHSSRVSRGLDALCEQGRLCTLDQLREHGGMPPPQPPLQEAERIASALVQYFS